MSQSVLPSPKIYCCSCNYNFYLICVNKNSKFMNPSKMSEIRRFPDVTSYSVQEASFLNSANVVLIRKSHKPFHVCAKCLMYILHILNPYLVANYKTLELLSPNCHGMMLHTQNCSTCYYSFILKNPNILVF